MSLSYHKDIHNSIKFCLESESDIGTVHGIGALIIKEIFGISDDEIVENLMLVLKELLGSKRYKDGRAGGSKPPLDAHPVHRSPPTPPPADSPAAAGRRCISYRCLFFIRATAFCGSSNSVGK